MSLFFAPGPSYRPTSTFLTNTFTAGQIFTGSDLGAAGAGEVRIGGGLVRAGVGIIGTDPTPGGSELLRVGGDIRASKLLIRDNGIEETATNAAAAIAINYNGYAVGTTQFRSFDIYNGKQSRIASFDGPTACVILGTDPNPGGSEKLRVGGTIRTTQGMYLASDTLLTPADGVSTPTDSRFLFRNTTDTYAALRVICNSATVAAIDAVQANNSAITKTLAFNINGGAVTIGTDPNPGGSERLRVGGSAVVGGSISASVGSGDVGVTLRSTGAYSSKIDLGAGGAGSGVIQINGANAVIIDTSQNVGIGVTPSTGNGKLQLPAGTAKTDGIGFGGDAFLHRDGAASVRLDAGTLTVKPSSGAVTMFVSPTGSGNGAAIEVGQGGSGNRNALIDLVGDDTYTDYGLRLIRGNTGANSASDIVHRGTGPLRLILPEAGAIEFNTNNTYRGSWSSSGVLTVSGTADGILVVNGKITAKAAVPASFADLAAVRTYLASILT